MAKATIPGLMQVSIRIVLGLLLGIVLADYAPESLPLWSWLVALFCVAARLSASTWRTLLIAALMGGLSHSYAEREHEGIIGHFSEDLDQGEGVEIEGVVDGIPVVWLGRQQLRLRTPKARIWLTIYGERAEYPEPLEPGQRLRVYARLKSPVGLRGLGTADRRRRILANGADLLASAAEEDLQLLGRQPSIWTWPSKVHFWALAKVDTGSSRQSGRAIVAALSTGDRSRMEEPLSKAVRASGLAHLLAVSGMHLAALVTMVFFVVMRAWCWSPWRQVLEPRAVAAAVALAAALGFTAMTGARPSTCRALLVASIVLIGIMLDRRVRLLHALAWAATILLLWRPALFWNAGFQMSFAATTALALAWKDSEGGLRFDSQLLSQKLLRGVCSLSRATFWATFATCPISLYHFGEASWIGLLTNLVAVPLTTLILLPGTIAALLLALIWPSASHGLLELVVLLADALASACFWAESVVPLAVRAPLSAWELGAWLAVALALLLRSRRLRRRRRVLIVGIASALLLLSRFLLGPYLADTREELRITFVEIGQGDAAVVEAPGGEVWLIDGGGLPFVAGGPGVDKQWIAESPARQALLPYLRHRRIDHIDLAIISHPHPDHYTGLQAVGRTMQIEELWSAHAARPVPGPYERWLESLANRGTKIVRPSLGKARDRNGASLHVLWPRYLGGESELPARAASDPILSVNDNSLVVRLDFAGRRVLFTGDIEEEAEEALATLFPEALRADLVKVPHHGSPTSSTTALIEASAAQVAVISCGRGNHFGFPAPAVEARWAKQVRTLLRTDLAGSITVQIAPTGRMRISAVEDF